MAERGKYPKSEYKRLHNIIGKIKQRCNNPNCKQYPQYGGRGIKVCDEWMADDGVEAFIEWALSHGYTDKLTCDRIDNDKGYSPDNCRWATYREQRLNRRDNLIVEYNGEKKPLRIWCDELGLDYKLVHGRIYESHMTAEQAFFAPKRTYPFIEMCRKYGVPSSVVRARVDQLGWTLEEALLTPVNKKGIYNHNLERVHGEIDESCYETKRIEQSF